MPQKGPRSRALAALAGGSQRRGAGATAKVCSARGSVQAAAIVVVVGGGGDGDGDGDVDGAAADDYVFAISALARRGNEPLPRKWSNEGDRKQSKGKD